MRVEEDDLVAKVDVRESHFWYVYVGVRSLSLSPSSTKLSACSLLCDFE